MPDELPAGADMLQEFNVAQLYRVEEYTDFAAGTVKVFTPVTDGGLRDVARGIRFISSVACSFQGMPMQVPFEIAASSLAEALLNWKQEALKAATAHVGALEKQLRERSILAPANGFPAPLRSRTSH